MLATKNYSAAKTCGECPNTGWVPVPNGGDDFDKEYCECPIGQAERDGIPDFTFGAGKCFNCDAPVSKFMTGCPTCHYSFCE